MLRGSNGREVDRLRPLNHRQVVGQGVCRVVVAIARVGHRDGGGTQWKSACDKGGETTAIQSTRSQQFAAVVESHPAGRSGSAACDRYRQGHQCAIRRGVSRRCYGHCRRTLGRGQGRCAGGAGIVIAVAGVACNHIVRAGGRRKRDSADRSSRRDLVFGQIHLYGAGVFARVRAGKATVCAEEDAGQVRVAVPIEVTHCEARNIVAGQQAHRRLESPVAFARQHRFFVERHGDVLK